MFIPETKTPDCPDGIKKVNEFIAAVERHNVTPEKTALVVVE